MKNVIVILLILFSFPFFSQSDFSAKRSFKPVTALSIFNNTFNSKDYYYGLSMGMEDLGYEWGVRFNFQFRPFYKRTQVQLTDYLITQYREKKFFVSVDIDKRFLNFYMNKIKMQFFVGSQFGILLGKYRGTRANAATLFNIAPLGGVSLNYKNEIFVKAGICYLQDNLLEVPDFKAVLNVIFALPDNTYQGVDIPFNDDDYY